MPGRSFADTNVVLYVYSVDEADKRTKARALLGERRPCVSTQVLSEAANVLRRKFGRDYAEIGAVIAEIRAACDVITVAADDIAAVLRLGERYRHGYFDCLILATAIAAGCDTLYSEDMHDGQVIEGCLTIRNPFL